MDDEKNYDDLLYPILHNEGEITGFLDAVFSFLSRRTDFFHIQEPNNPGIGLPPRNAQELVKKSFYKYYHLMQENTTITDENVPLSDATVEVTSVDELEEVVTKTSSEACVKSEKPKNDDKIYVSDPEGYNGAVYDNYSWSQSIKDLDVLVKVPSDIASGKTVKVVLQSSKLKVEVLQENEWQVLIDEDFRWDINVEESLWTLIPHKHIHVCLEKIKERWWDAVFQSEPKIDIKNIDASQPYSDLDEESQAKIRELMYNEQQKRLGKPTIEQAKIAEVLKDAWDLEGSPFRGMPYDPNVALSSSTSGTPYTEK